jgi:hypothetical protein
MATESSAIVRFISAAQQQHHTMEDRSAAVPDLTDDLDDLQPIRRSYGLPVIVLAALAFAAVAAAVGVYVGKNYFPDDGQTEPAAAPGTTTALTAAAARPAPAPPRPGPASEAPAAPAAPTAAPAAAPAPAAPALTPQVLAATGFDIRVKPQATITLDGRVLGKSPLRVRNLTPGAHVVDVEAPAGFFSRRVEIELNAGEPQNVNLALDPIDPSDSDSDSASEGEGEGEGEGAGDDSKATTAKKSKKAARAKAKARAAKARRERRARHKARRKRAKVEAEIAAAVALPDDRAGSDKPAGAPAPATGTLMVGSKPPCDIYIDGEPTGLKTPQRAIEVAAGTHRITLINAELDIKKSFVVKITAGKSTRAIHDLTGKI